MSTSDAQDPVTIFVVDDEPLLLDLAKTVLNPLGYNLRLFTNPAEALAEYPAAKPAIVITDYAMDGMTGLDVLRECRRINPRQKVILLSGTVDESIFNSEPAKPDLFLAKPYQVRELVLAVKKLLNP
ncbi:MAG TPA: response regulator [Verrucomicrobiae bacterium]|jgi:CheY-like chemotaxis protein